jgi:hypothetical protein
LDNSKCINFFMKLCLKSQCHFMGIDSFVSEKSDDYSLITFHLNRPFNEFSSAG